MEVDISKDNQDLKPEIEMLNTICRCCLSKNRNGNNIMMYSGLFFDLAEITVTESDGLPQWLCWECIALLQKSVRFKQKLQRSHMLLYEYVTRCAPFPIDGQDPELTKYESPQLSSTTTLVFDNDSRSKNGFHKVLEHEKQILNPMKETISVIVEKIEDNIKEETNFSDFEDNLTLEEFSTEVTEALDGSDEKKSRKTSIRKPPELDPKKIRVIILNPEEQIKMKEEESKASDKFPFQCKLCFKGFNFESKLQNHMFKHSPSRGTFECSLCHMYLPSAYSASVHALIHTRRYECLECGRRMIDRASILEHYSAQHEGIVNQYTCSQCGKVSNNKKTHRSHVRNHHESDRPRCDQCGKSFVNKDSLVEHMQIHDGVKNYVCPECGARFRTRTQMRDHKRKHSDERDYYCVECDTRFKSPNSLKQHLLKSRKHVDSHSLKYSCMCCDKRFPTERALRHHIGVQHEGVRAHRCVQCPAALATRNSLNKHVRAVHAGARPPARHVCDTCGRAFRLVYKCDVTLYRYSCMCCDKRFPTERALRHHIGVQHEGVRAHRCVQCPAALATRNSLNKHVRAVHAGARPPARHVCDTCGRAFRGKSVLMNHVRTHTGEKPFSCAECGRRFTQRTAMRTHTRLVHLKVRRNAKVSVYTDRHVSTCTLYSCAECGRRFTQRTAMRTHTRLVHLKVRRNAKVSVYTDRHVSTCTLYSCAECGRRFTQRTAMRTHTRLVHLKVRRNAKVSVYTDRHVSTCTLYSCAECGRRFTQRTAMRTHTRLVHLKVRRNAKVSVYTDRHVSTCTRAHRHVSTCTLYLCSQTRVSVYTVLVR
ncbi:Zinc finger protein 160 [Papilio machaon]|uniref:Zinc finger protein 160 n=1 Tax=Papilio machaon TaxID=76193 RepID=A0A0N1IFW2_PAPMA|nr:Zinc finger protein 160 [Papilio machaon]